VISKYNKFFIQLIERGCSNLIYWDKETKVRIVLKSINVLNCETIMKIRLVQQEILTIGG
jgi:uncharacterized protein YbcV (DUF1398 family)